MTMRYCAELCSVRDHYSAEARALWYWSDSGMKYHMATMTPHCVCTGKCHISVCVEGTMEDSILATRREVVCVAMTRNEDGVLVSSVHRSAKRKIAWYEHSREPDLIEPPSPRASAPQLIKRVETREICAALAAPLNLATSRLLLDRDVDARIHTSFLPAHGTCKPPTGRHARCYRPLLQAHQIVKSSGLVLDFVPIVPVTGKWGSQNVARRGSSCDLAIVVHTCCGLIRSAPVDQSPPSPHIGITLAMSQRTACSTDKVQSLALGLSIMFHDWTLSPLFNIQDIAGVKRESPRRALEPRKHSLPILPSPSDLQAPEHVPSRDDILPAQSGML
ncbi:hypothetical protein DE146DRAFT_772350 [Phaeosphaeria sp. MPI-PUGE-AT-0046c]|nr:hypothetical protein DE146DRAFT_772350 [Phaeosphaeria sp. MPI-PUGE-AT-0046c]